MPLYDCALKIGADRVARSSMVVTTVSDRPEYRDGIRCAQAILLLRSEQSRSRKSAQGDKWSFCLTAGTLWPANQERPCNDDRAGTTHRLSRRRWRLPPSRAIEHWLSLASSSTFTPIRSRRGRRSLRKGQP